MLETPLGAIQVCIDGTPVEYCVHPCSLTKSVSSLSGRYVISVDFEPDGKVHSLSCRMKGYCPSAKDTDEGGENLECRSFYYDTVKLSLGMEGDMCFLNGKRMSDYDYDTQTLSDGVSYQILTGTKTSHYVFGIAWISPYTPENQIQTWLGADPTVF